MTDSRHPLDIWSALPMPGSGDRPLPEPPAPMDPAEPASPREATARDIAAATGNHVGTIRNRARRQAWPHRKAGSGPTAVKIYDIACLPEEIRDQARKARPRRGRSGAGRDHGIRIPPRKRRAFLDLRGGAR